MVYLFCPFTFNLFVSLTLKCVTCREHTVGSRSSLSTFLIGMFNTFTACKSLCWWARTAEVAILTAFQSLLWRFYSHIFLLSFGSGSYFHNCYWPLSSWVSVATDCFWQRPWGQGFPADQVLSSSQVKWQQWNRAFPGSWTTGQIGTMLSEWPFFFFLRRPSKPCPSSGCKPAGFQGYCRPEQREMGAVQVATPQTLLNEIQQFFLNKYSSDCWKPLANFKSSEIADFGHLCQCFHCF